MGQGGGVEGVDIGAVVGLEGEMDIGAALVVGADPEIGIIPADPGRAGKLQQDMVAQGRHGSRVEGEQGIEQGGAKADMVEHGTSPWLGRHGAAPC